MNELYELLKVLIFDEDLICVEAYDESNRYYQLKKEVDSGNQLYALCKKSNESKFLETTIKELTSKLVTIVQRSNFIILPKHHLVDVWSECKFTQKYLKIEE